MMYREGKQGSPMEVVVLSPGFCYRSFGKHVGRHTEKRGDGMEPEERATGARNYEYNLVSVLYHALHGAETCEMYALDAEAAGDDELAGFFRNVQATHRQVGEQAKTQLYTRHAAALGTAEAQTPLPPEGMTGPEAPPPPRDVRRGTSTEPPRTPRRMPTPPRRRRRRRRHAYPGRRAGTGA
jgi:hypothetical protein